MSQHDGERFYLLCGDCKRWSPCGRRSDDTQGQRPGVCAVTGERINRTDWCRTTGGVYDGTRELGK